MVKMSIQLIRCRIPNQTHTSVLNALWANFIVYVGMLVTPPSADNLVDRSLLHPGILLYHNPADTTQLRFSVRFNRDPKIRSKQRLAGGTEGKGRGGQRGAGAPPRRPSQCRTMVRPPPERVAVATRSLHGSAGLARIGPRPPPPPRFVRRGGARARLCSRPPPQAGAGRPSP